MMNKTQQQVLSLINRQELIDLALTLGNTPSPAGNESPTGEVIFDWLQRNAFSPRKIGFVAERFCVVGTLPGSGEGPSLAFNSHMDTSNPKDDPRRRNPDAPVYQQAWLDGDEIVGQGIVNDKGPMAAWMIASDAIRRAEVPLKGDLVLTMVPGEIDQEPVDEFTAPRYLSKEVGARYLLTRGVVADYALVAEGTRFNVTWVGAGKACFKITTYGQGQYVPFLPNRGKPAESPNAIIKAAVLMLALEDWAAQYQAANTIDLAGGRVVPKANIGAIRGGSPSHISSSAETCHLYMDVRLAPGVDPLAIRAALRRVVAECGIEAAVELYTFRKPQVADRVEPLVDAIAKAHEAMEIERPVLADAPYSSMWRDHIAFIEAGVPALTYGPGTASSSLRMAMRIDDLVKAAQLYALIALDICTRTK